MDTLIRSILDASQVDEWLTQHGLGWLVSDRVVETTSIVIGSILVYYIGRLFIELGVKNVIRSTAKHRAWHRKDIEKREATLVQLMRSFWLIIVIAYVIMMTVNKLFLFDLSPLFASAGIIGIALGFGAQSLVKDFLSGIFIIAENQYRVGDVVTIGDANGTVERVGTRSTVLRDVEGSVHYLPNGTIQHVVNKTMGYSMSRFTLQIDPSADVSVVVEIINATGQKLATETDWSHKIIEPPKFVAMGDITGRSVEMIVAGKVQPSDQWSVTSEMRRRLLRTFEDKGIELATLPLSGSAKK